MILVMNKGVHLLTPVTQAEVHKFMKHMQSAIATWHIQGKPKSGDLA